MEMGKIRKNMQINLRTYIHYTSQHISQQKEKHTPLRDVSPLPLLLPKPSPTVGGSCLPCVSLASAWGTSRGSKKD